MTTLTKQSKRWNMIKGKTKSGFSFQLEESALDNFELIEEFAKADSGDVGALVRGITMLLGEEQKKRLYEHLRTDKGNVPIEAFQKAIFEIMEKAGVETKNF